MPKGGIFPTNGCDFCWGRPELRVCLSTHPVLPGPGTASCCPFLPKCPPKLSLTRFPWEAVLQMWGESQLCTTHPQRCPAAHSGTETGLFTKSCFSNRLSSKFVVLFPVPGWAFQAWKPSLTGRWKARGHSPPPPRLSLQDLRGGIQLPLANSCCHSCQDGLCPPSASPGPSPWVLPAKPPWPPQRHSVLAGVPGQRTHTRGSDRSRRFP